MSNTTKPTLLESLCQEPEFIENTLSNMTKPTLLESLSQESVSLKIDNDLLSNTTKPTLLDSLSQYYVSLEIENELLSNTTKFTLLDSLRQDFDLSIKAYSLLQELCINFFKSNYMLVFYKMDG